MKFKGHLSKIQAASNVWKKFYVAHPPYTHIIHMGACCKYNFLIYTLKSGVIIPPLQLKFNLGPFPSSVVLSPSLVTNRLQIILSQEEILLRNNYLRVTTGTV